MALGSALPIAIRVRGVNWRRFMLGYRSVPPATSITVRPGVPVFAASCSSAWCSRRRSAASSIVAGVCSWKRGSLSIALALPSGRGCGEPAQCRLRIRGGRAAVALEAGGPDAVLLLGQRVEDLLGRDRRLVEANADRVEHRVRDGRDHRIERAFPGF